MAMDPSQKRARLAMEPVRLPGDVELVVSPVCLGTMSFVGAGGMGSTDEDVALAVIHRAIREGVNFFDTAEAYIDHAADRVLGKALNMAFGQGLTTRDKVVVAGKFGRHEGERAIEYTADMIEAALVKTLDALGMDCLDIYQVHWAANMKSAKETVETLERLKSIGKIRSYGVCNFGVQSLQEFLDCGGHPITNQLPYNLLWRAIEFEILPMCREKEIAVLTYSSLQQGLLTGKFTEASEVPEGRRRTRHFPGTSTSLSRHGQAGCEALTFETIKQLRQVVGDGMADASVQWLLRQSGVASVLIGASMAEQVSANVKAVCNKMDDDVARKFMDSTEDLKTSLGPDPDMWAKNSRYR